MKTKFLRKLRKKAKKKICLVQTGNCDWEVRNYYGDNKYFTLYRIRGTWPLGESLNKMYELRRDYILRELKKMRTSVYPKIIDI